MLQLPFIGPGTERLCESLNGHQGLEKCKRRVLFIEACLNHKELHAPSHNRTGTEQRGVEGSNEGHAGPWLSMAPPAHPERASEAAHAEGR